MQPSPQSSFQTFPSALMGNFKHLHRPNRREVWGLEPSFCRSKPNTGSHLLSPAQQGSVAETGSQEMWLLGVLRTGWATSSYIFLGPCQGDRPSHTLICRIILILASGIHLFSLSSFLSFTISLPYPWRLRQVSASHLSGLSEHLVT